MGCFTDDLNGNRCCKNTLLQFTHSLAWVFICSVNLDDDGWQGCLQGIFWLHKTASFHGCASWSSRQRGWVCSGVRILHFSFIVWNLMVHCNSSGATLQTWGFCFFGFLLLGLGASKNKKKLECSFRVHCTAGCLSLMPNRIYQQLCMNQLKLWLLCDCLSQCFPWKLWNCNMLLMAPTDWKW